MGTSRRDAVGASVRKSAVPFSLISSADRCRSVVTIKTSPDREDAWIGVSSLKRYNTVHETLLSFGVRDADILPLLS